MFLVRAHNPKVVSSNLTPATNLRVTGRAQVPGLFLSVPNLKNELAYRCESRNLGKAPG